MLLPHCVIAARKGALTQLFESIVAGATSQPAQTAGSLAKGAANGWFSRLRQNIGEITLRATKSDLFGPN